MHIRFIITSWSCIHFIARHLVSLAPLTPPPTPSVCLFVIGSGIVLSFQVFTKLSSLVSHCSCSSNLQYGQKTQHFKFQISLFPFGGGSFYPLRVAPDVKSFFWKINWGLLKTIFFYIMETPEVLLLVQYLSEYISMTTWQCDSNKRCGSFATKDKDTGFSQKWIFLRAEIGSITEP